MQVLALGPFHCRNTASTGVPATVTMTSAELETIVRIGGLKREPPSGRESDGLLHSGTARLVVDAANENLALQSVPTSRTTRRTPLC